MSPTLYARVVGYRTLATDACHAAALLELCRRKCFSYHAFCTAEDGSVELTFTLWTARSVMESAAAWGIPLCTCRTGGLPTLGLRLLRRPGLLLGALVGVILLTLASRVVWDIRITGNETVSDRSIEETLAACGFGVGSSFANFRADVTENRILMADERLAWISINRRGTVAYVEVRERARTPVADPDTPADIVASIGGIIERVELEEGNVRVSAGQIVGEGDVLVSGLYDSIWEGIRYTHAKAEVFARTEREIVVSIPLSYEQKVYATDEKGTLLDAYHEKSVIFFGKEIKFSKKTGNGEAFCDTISSVPAQDVPAPGTPRPENAKCNCVLHFPQNYDTIESEDLLSPVGSVGFPLSVRTTWYLPYTVTTATRTHAEAEELAYIELARQIASLPGGAEILQKTVTTHRTEDTFFLVCHLTAVENIGTTRPIEVEMPS